jgi:CRISPR/Cas system CSM-associated protein Csm4 (group 5 of RAMP superfamily)
MSPKLHSNNCFSAGSCFAISTYLGRSALLIGSSDDTPSINVNSRFLHDGASCFLKKISGIKKASERNDELKFKQLVNIKFKQQMNTEFVSNPENLEKTEHFSEKPD